MNSIQKIRLSLKEYKELYNDLYFSLCLFADKYVKDLELSKDLVQDVFVKIWKDEIEFQSKNAIKSYLYNAVRNKCLDTLKNKSYQAKKPLTEVELAILESDSYFEKEVLIEEVSTALHNAVNTLPEKCRQIMRLSLRGLENSQISEELSLSVNTVKAQKRIAYQKLKPILKESILGLFYYLFI
ncbi:RNA polymerase sigma-70 factor [Wenyingzhuangia sp. IMCC45574]